MINLLNANFIRLRKNKIFWILTIFSIGVSLCIVFAQYHQMIKYGDEIQVAQLLLNYSTLAGVVIAIFTSLFVGVEYSDGGIRNKIIIGHKRINIYLSSLVTNMIISIFYYILYMIMIVSLGIPLFGIGTVPISIILTKILIIFVIMMAYCSIFTFIAMLCSNKTITAIVTIIFAFGLMILGLFCYEILGTPRYTETATIVDGETKIEKVLNPKYPSEVKKKVYQILLDMNPAGQTYQLHERNSKLEILSVYSLGISIVFTGAGVMLFQRKELK